MIWQPESLLTLCKLTAEERYDRYCQKSRIKSWCDVYSQYVTVVSYNESCGEKQLKFIYYGSLNSPK